MDFSPRKATTATTHWITAHWIIQVLQTVLWHCDTEVVRKGIISVPYYSLLKVKCAMELATNSWWMLRWLQDKIPWEGRHYLMWWQSKPYIVWLSQPNQTPAAKVTQVSGMNRGSYRTKHWEDTHSGEPFSLPHRLIVINLMFGWLERHCSRLFPWLCCSSLFYHTFPVHIKILLSCLYRSHVLEDVCTYSPV